MFADAVQTPVTTYTFTASEGAGGHCEGLGQDVFDQFVYGWLCHQVEGSPTAGGATERSPDETDAAVGLTRVFEDDEDSVVAPSGIIGTPDGDISFTSIGNGRYRQDPSFRRSHRDFHGSADTVVASGDLTMGGRTKADGTVDFTNLDHADATRSSVRPSPPRIPSPGYYGDAVVRHLRGRRERVDNDARLLQRQGVRDIEATEGATASEETRAGHRHPMPAQPSLVRSARRVR